MKRVVSLPVKLLGLAFCLCASMTACSGAQEEQEPVAAEKTVEKEPEVAEATEEKTPPEEVPAAPQLLPQPQKEVAPTPAVAASGNNRVVRYLKADTTIMAAPKDDAAKVATMKKGDRVIVSEEGAWARIADNMFVKADVISAKAVAPERHNAVWQSPSH